MTDPTAPMPSDQPAQPADVPPQSSGATVPPAGARPEGNMLADASPVPATSTRRSNARAWAVGGIALVIALCCGGIGIAALSDDKGEPTAGASATPSLTSAAPTSVAPTTAAATTAPATTAPPVPTYDTPTKTDFKLKVKILRKQCFGSAGCNVTYRIDVTYAGTGLDPSTTYEVTYQVKGAEDPIINTFEVTGDSASVQQEEMASTKRSGDKLTAVVTDVAEL